MPALFTSLLDDPITDDVPDTPADVSAPTTLAAPQDFHVITLTSVSHEAGATTLSVLLASMLSLVSEREIRVAVLDMNTYNKELFFYSEAPQLRFIDICAHQLPTSLAEYCLQTKHGFDEYFVFGDTSSSYETKNQQFGKLIHLLKQDYDIVVLDAGSSTPEYSEIASRHSENTLCVIDCGNQSESQQIDKARKLKKNSSTFGLILNRNNRSLLSTFQQTADTRKSMNIVAGFPFISGISSNWLERASQDESIQIVVKQLVKNTLGTKFLTPNP